MAYIPHGRLNGKKAEANGRGYLRTELVLEAVNEYFGTTTEILLKKSRKREIVWPRQVAMYFLSFYTIMPLKGIGIILGGKDHTTVIHAIDTVNNLKDSDILVKEQIQLLTQKFDQYIARQRDEEHQQYLGNA